MKYDTRTNAHKACSKTPNRFAINDVVLRNDRLMATDGRIAVSIPVEVEEGDTDGIISKDALTLAQKTKSNIGANGSLQIGGTQMPRPEGDAESFPNLEEVISDFCPMRVDEKPIEVTLDAILLKTLLDAMGAFKKRGKTGGAVKFIIGHARPSTGTELRDDATPIVHLELMEECGDTPDAAIGKPIVGVIMPQTSH